MNVHMDTDYDYIIYCHNNDKECPFGDNWMHEHDKSEKYKFGQACERIKCMYRHDDEDKESDGDGNGLTMHNKAKHPTKEK